MVAGLCLGFVWCSLKGIAFHSFHSCRLERVRETALLKCLKVLRDAVDPLHLQDIVQTVGENEEDVAKALQKLGEREVVIEWGGRYSYNRTSANEDFCQRMLAVYERLSEMSEMESLVVGLLFAAAQRRHVVSQHTLVSVLEEEGFKPQEVASRLEEEVSEGRVRKLKVAIRKDSEEVFPVSPTLPWHYIARLVRMKADEYDKVSKRWAEEGFFVQEEDYLIADFPSGMARPMAEYVRRERVHIARKLEEACLQWWVGLRVGCRYFDVE